MSRDRREVRALIPPRLELLATDHDRQVLAYLRPGAGRKAGALALPPYGDVIVLPGVRSHAADAPIRARR